MADVSGSPLARLPGCARASPKALAALEAQARQLEAPAGTRLVEEGEPAPDWYGVILSGAVHIARSGISGDEVLERLAAGDVVDPGVPGAPAAWSATAVEPTRCLLLPQSAVGRWRLAAREGLSDDRSQARLFMGRVGDLVKGPPLTCPLDTPVAEAARLMASRSVGSVIVIDAAGEPAGILTDRDLRIKVVAERRPGDRPVAEIMSRPLVTIESAQMVFDAVLEMTRRGIHHLPVLGAEGRLVGVISSHDLMLMQGAHPVALGRQIEEQRTEAGLAETAPRVEAVVRWLAAAGAGPLEIGRIVAELNDRVVARALDLALEGAEREGAGRAPVPFSWLAAGSEGRKEQTLRTDQDNGLVYEDSGDEAPEVRPYFDGLARRMAGILERLGFPRCPGGYMAANPHWCQPGSVWRQRFEGWMAVPRPASLLDASMFCDLRPVAGDAAVGWRLWDWVCERAPGQRLFLGHMAVAALERHVPLGLFGSFVVERSGVHRGALDLKARGVFPVTQAMRVYALSLGCRHTNTVDRLGAAQASGIFTPGEARELREAHDVIARLRLSHQIAQIDAGQPPDNFIAPDALGRGDRLLLREAFRTIAWLQRHLEDRFQTSLLG